MDLTAEDLRRAMRRGEFSFHYQPKVSFLTGRVEGAEALIRWRLPDGTLVPPGDFIPMAEASGMVADVTRHMFPRLLDDLSQVHAERGEDRLALNISANELDDPGLIHLVREAIDSNRIRGPHLEIEITEGVVVSRQEVIVRRLTELMEAGVSLAMDDYGTGFSSLETLSRLPFSVLKLDQAFVIRMLASTKTATMVRTSIAMAQLLGIRSVMEGVETEEAYRMLLHYGCTEAQGYWISPPLPLPDYLEFRRRDPVWPCSPIGMLRMAQLTHTWQYKLLMDMLFAHLEDPGTPGSIPRHLHMSPDECALGDWYHGLGQALSGDPDFDRLDRPHRRMHELCAEMFDATSRKAPRHRIRQLMTDLSEESSALYTTLQRLEMRLMFEELGAPE
ncbi:MAG: EAL domain-containing protein [Thioalkalivibrio sp.]|nr:MAG: EAL domain-containing protein [Thioalkalivibrio sp.]